MAPMRVFQSRINYASWLTDETKLVMQERDRAMALYNTTRLPADWEEARQLRNKTTRLLKTEKANSVKKSNKQCETEKDHGRVWKNVRNYLGWGGSTSAPTKLINSAGQLITSPSQMADLQNRY